MELRSTVPSFSRAGLAGVRLPFASDEGLARLVPRGDRAAFRLLYERYHQPLYRYCRSLLRHEADAQDALQSTFTAAFSALADGRRDAPIRPWLFRIAHNESVSVLRRRRPELELSELTPPSTVSLEEQVEQRERFSTLVSDLGELTDRQRGALVTRELSGLSHDEIALALDTPVNAAKQTIFEARRALTEFAEGRAMACDEVCRLISESDGRMLRGRRIRAHLRECSACAAFAAMIPERRAQLRALAPPLPAIAAGGILMRALGGGSTSAGKGAGLVTAGAGKTLGTAIMVKASAVVVTATVAVGVTAVVKHASPAEHPAPRTHRATVSSSTHRATGSSARTVDSSAAVPARTAAGRHPLSRVSGANTSGLARRPNRRPAAHMVARKSTGSRAGSVPAARGSVPAARGTPGSTAPGQRRQPARSGASTAAPRPAASGRASSGSGQKSQAGARPSRPSSVTTPRRARGGSSRPGSLRTGPRLKPSKPRLRARLKPHLPLAGSTQPAGPGRRLR